MESPFHCVLAAQAVLGESPVWAVDEQALYWADINGRSLNRFDPAHGVNTRWELPEVIGAFALRAQGGFLLALRSGLWFADTQGTLQRQAIPAPYETSTHRFNDGRVDSRGRFWVGSMNEKRDAATGALYRVDPDLTLTRVIDGVMISNGLAFSRDDRVLYHADTHMRTINAYAFDAQSAALSVKREFYHGAAENDRPDGAAVDREGNYWCAFYRGGLVRQIAPDGSVLREIPVPAKCPTMCAFGGADLRTLYVTSARQFRPPEELAELPDSGGIFALRVEVPGLPEPKFLG